MLLTIALNPSVIRQINLDKLNYGNANVAQSDNLSVGDCGIYSAYVLKIMQVDPYVMSITGGIGGRFVKNFLDRNRIKTDFLQVDYEIKTHLFISDISQNQTTSIISHNNSLSQKDFVNIKHKLNHHLAETQIVAISGEDPYLPGIVDDIHAMSKDTKKIIVNTRGNVIKEVLTRNVFATLIDYNDLSMLGIEFEFSEDCFEKIKMYQKAHHIRYIIIKTSNRLIGFTKSKICMVSYEAKDSVFSIINSTVFGGLIVGIRRNYPFERMMKLMGTLANNCSLSEYPFIVNRHDINQGINKTKIIELFNARNGYCMGEQIW